jgi:hypothetical protein
VYREGALEVAASLDPALVAVVLDVPAPGDGDVVTRLARLRADPWYDPTLGSRRTEPQRVGGFRGFGGPFVRPPLVAPAAGPLPDPLPGPDAGPGAGGRVVAFDGEGAWYVCADAFGTGLVRAATEPAALVEEPPPALDLLELTSWVHAPGGVAATSALSHAVTFVPGPEPAV